MKHVYRTGDIFTSAEAAALGLDTYTLFASVREPMDSDNDAMQRFSGESEVVEIGDLKLEIRCEYEIPGHMLQASGWTDACSDHLMDVTPDFVVVQIEEA